MTVFNVEPLQDEMALGCPCCEPGPSGLRGLVYEDKTPHALYSAKPSRISGGPLLMTVTVGPWQRENSFRDRKTVALTCVRRANGLDVQAAEFDMDVWADMMGQGIPLTRSELEHDADYAQIVRLARAIVNQDRRLAALAAGTPPTHGRFSADGPGMAV